MAALLLSACASTFDPLPEALGGLPNNAPARQAEQAAFPQVYTPPQQRDVKSLSDDEQKKLGADLLSLRNSQTERAKDPEAAGKKAIAEKKAADKQAADKKAAERKAALKKQQNARKTAAKQGDTRPPEPKPLDLKAN